MSQHTPKPIFEQAELLSILDDLTLASVELYERLKAGSGLRKADSTNHSNDVQLELDVFADQCFRKRLASNKGIRYILSEEEVNISQRYSGDYSVALDPLDGSKSAMVGIPSGAIFGIFKDCSSLTDFVGKNVVASGFFVFGINLELFIANGTKAWKGIYQNETKTWLYEPLDPIKQCSMFAVNASNKKHWEPWLQLFYDDLFTRKGYNTRWYASMVSEIKRLVLQGGLFAYPADRRPGYENGHLRLLYEAIPMAHFIETLGGASCNGMEPIKGLAVRELHQKTPLFLGDKTLIASIMHKSTEAL